MLSVIQSLGGEANFAKLLKGFDEKKQIVRFALLISALALLIFGLANPQISGQKKAAQQDGTNVILALDVSNSMMAEDIAPSRLERARAFFGDLLHALKGNRVGLVLFAGSADLEAPPSNDYNYTANKLATLSTESVPQQGTSIAAALRKAKLALANKPGAIVLVTDGENHTGDVLSVAKSLKKRGVYLMVFGIGTPTGAPIPDAKSGYKKNDAGNTVHSKLNEQTLKELAEVAGGSAAMLTDNARATQTVIEKISQLENGTIKTVDMTSYNSFFQFLLIPVFLLLLGEWYWAQVYEKK